MKKLNAPDLDHTADVQCHAWGGSLIEAFQNMAPCMFNYITDISKVQINPTRSSSIEVNGTFFAQFWCVHFFS
jgi:SHS2 domain-containing protein